MYISPCYCSSIQSISRMLTKWAKSLIHFMLSFITAQNKARNPQVSVCIYNSIQRTNIFRCSKIKIFMLNLNGMIMLKAVRIIFFPLSRIQRSGLRWWSRTLLPRGSSPATEPSRSTPRRSGGWSPLTWRSRPPASQGRPSRKRPEHLRRCEEDQSVASLPAKSHLCLFTSFLCCPQICA